MSFKRLCWGSGLSFVIPIKKSVTEVYDKGWSCYTSRMYCFLSWVCSGLKVLAPEESRVPSSRNTPFLVRNKQQMLSMWALKVGSVFAFSGSQWEEACNACGIWVSCPCGGVQGREAFETLTVLLPGTHVFSFLLSWPHFFFCSPNRNASS